MSEFENLSAQIFQLFVCGRNTSSIFDPENQGSVRQLEELREQIKKETESPKNDTFEYSYDNTTCKF